MFSLANHDGAAGHNAYEPSGEAVVKLESTDSFTDTLTRLQSTLERNGFRIFAIIDHQAAARSVGLDMPATTVLVYGNPKGGTPLMLAAPDFALELPLRVLVREDPDMGVRVIIKLSQQLRIVCTCNLHRNLTDIMPTDTVLDNEKLPEDKELYP
jgi:uncharacterized protein (DUF302 family)